MKKSLILVGLCIALVILFLFISKGVLSYISPDAWCSRHRETSSRFPKDSPTSAQGFFEFGNYHYDVGDCRQAVNDYTNSIDLNPKFAEAYNNRAYTNMRLRDYKDALPDLDTAIKFRPNYVNALMNRGDIYNYYYNIDKKRAISDYDRVLAMGPDKYKGTSLCGHRLLAKNGGWGPEIYLQVFIKGTSAGCK